jgi:CHAD domain-containing protein
MTDAYEERSPESFHEWRKRVKYLWYHMRILRPIWDDVLDELADSIHDLSDYLGDHHDLTELKILVQDKPEWFDDEREHSLLLGLIERRQTELEAEARTVGMRVYSEKPKAFTRRMADYWVAYQLELEEELTA